MRAKEAQANVRRAGLQDVVQVIAGDAFKEIPNVQGTFDLVFLDAWKPDYKKFFDLVFPRVSPGGLFLAHNVINKKNEMQDFLGAIAAHPQALNTTVSPGPRGHLDHVQETALVSSYQLPVQRRRSPLESSPDAL